MDVFWGVVIVLLTLPCWAGQLMSWLWPTTAIRLQLTEDPADVHAVYAADIRGEAIWDSFTLWVMPVAGVLLIAGSDTWAYFGLCGAGMYLYFAGRGILTRRIMQQRGMSIGAPDSVKVAYLALSVWGVLALAVLVSAVAALA